MPRTPKTRIALALITLLIACGEVPDNGATTIFEREANRWFSRHPAQQDSLDAYLAERGATTFSEGEAYGRTLASKGMLRLDDQSLVRRSAILASGIHNLDEADCSQFAGSHIQPVVLEKVYSSLSAAQLTELVNLSMDALMAEIRENPPPSAPDTTAVSEAILSLSQGLSAPESDRFYATFADPDASAMDRCWLAKLIFDASITLPAPHNYVIARALVSF